MRRFVVDASVAIKWYVPEADSERALTLLDEENELASPDLLFAEIGNVLWKKIRRNEMTLDDGQATLHALHQTPIAIHSAGDLQLAQTSLALSAQNGCSFYDSLYVSLASLLGWPLVTADRKLFELFRSVRGASRLIPIEDVL